MEYLLETRMIGGETLWKRLDFVNWDDDIPNIWEKNHVPVTTNQISHQIPLNRHFPIVFLCFSRDKMDDLRLAPPETILNTSAMAGDDSLYQWRCDVRSISFLHVYCYVSVCSGNVRSIERTILVCIKIKYPEISMVYHPFFVIKMRIFHGKPGNPHIFP